MKPTPRSNRLPSARTGLSRSGWVLGWLAAALVLVTALAWEAITAMRARHELTDHVLTDYAQLAAAGYAARITAELEIFAFDPGLEVLHARPARLPAPAPIVIETEPGTRLSIPLVRSYFRLPLDLGPLEVSGEALTAAERGTIADTLRTAAAAAEREGWTSAALLLPGDSTRVLVYRPIRDAAGRTVEVVGFDAAPAGLAVYFEYSFAIRALVPPPLTRGTPQDSLTSIELLTPSGAVVYHSRWVHRSPWSGTRDLGARFGHLRARAVLAPDAPARVIPPGPPSTQGWLLIALGAVCVALLAGSIVQIRRESELQRLRLDFVMSASHELRTPLAQIRMFAETLRLGRVRDDGERARSLAILDQEATRLSRLVENLLTFSRAERRSLRIAAEPVDLSALLRDIAEGFAPLATAVGMRLETRVPDGLRLEADRDAVRQIVLNLLDNAAKHGAAGQTIELASSTDAGAVEVSVQDQGAGIPAADRRRVWERFVRLPHADGTRATGTGIGLSVVRELVILHGGSVQVEDGQNGGARFVIRLPSEPAR